MAKYTVHETKTQLSKLLQKSAQGEEVIITNRGEPVAKLVRISPSKKRNWGWLKGEVYIAPDFNQTPEGFEDYQ